MGERSSRKKAEKREKKKKFIQKIKDKLIDSYEEFKLNREGKTKRKRADVKSRYRKIDRNLTALIIILILLLVISWVIVLFY
ncbi:MAG: hypothetical protein L0I79_06930 [Atopostipes sp.]|nr:hypothetical protein [Atopostipes sp.]